VKRRETAPPSTKGTFYHDRDTRQDKTASSGPENKKAVDEMIENAAQDLIGIEVPYLWADGAKAALSSLGLPLETLAALKVGTMVAVPVDPTLEMVAKGEASHAHGGGAVAIFDAMISSAPKVPE